MKKRRTDLEYHGKSRRGKQSPEYMVWAQIVQRCHNKNHPKYPRYGGRGITMDPRWRESFVTFLKEVKKRPTKKHQIERIDNDKGYWPGNVRWATRLQQAQNTSRSRFVEINGKRLTIATVARRHRKNRKRIRERLESGMTIEQAISRPMTQCRVYITYKGTERTLKEWSRVLNFPYNTLYSRIYKMKWPVERAFTEPSGRSLVAGMGVAPTVSGL